MPNMENEKYEGDFAPAQPEDTTRISDEVLSTIAGVELSRIEGVAPVGGGITDFLGMKSPSKGIKIEAHGEEITVEVVVIVDYGVNIPEIAQEIQTKLRKAITGMTGKFVNAVNVTIQGIKTNVGKHGPSEENKPQGDKEEEVECVQ